MAETKTAVTVNGSPLHGHDLDLVQSINVEETLGSPDKVSITVALTTDDKSGWTCALDPLVAPAKPLAVTITRDRLSLTVDALSVSASWTIAPGGLSTLTVEGMDRSIELDREQVQYPWRDAADSDIAKALFRKHHLKPDVTDTPKRVSSDVYTPLQNETDWAFLKGLAARNGFDVRVESVDQVATGVFKKIDLSATPQTTLKLGYGELGGPASASVQLLAGQEVHVTSTIAGTTNTDKGQADGKAVSLGTRPLGAATVVRMHTAQGKAVVDAQTTANAFAERQAFGANLSTTLTSPQAPLVRARRTITVAGLGEALDGRWLVQSVRHTITPGGHTQALTLIRNALGAPGAGNALAGLATSAAAQIGIAL